MKSLLRIADSFLKKHPLLCIIIILAWGLWAFAKGSEYDRIFFIMVNGVNIIGWLVAKYGKPPE